MIIFKSPETLVSFLEHKLPPKIREDLFFSKYTWEHKGKEREGKIALKPRAIVAILRNEGFVVGLTDKGDRCSYPETYILLWTRLMKHLEQTDSLTFEQEQYSLISINKACKMLDVTRPTLYKIINEKKIPYVQILSQKRIQLKDLLDFIANNKKYK